jgi:pilus assembly protein CpaB
MASKPKAVFIIGGIAVIAAAVFSWFLLQYLQTQDARLERMKAEAVATEQVVVAAVDIPLGTVIVPASVKAVDWPKTNIPAGAVNSTGAAAGRVAVVPLQPGDPVTESKLIPIEGAPGIMSYKVPEGHRAMTVGVDQVSGIAGFIVPGNKVDLIVTTKPAESKEYVSKIFLEDIPVLATGQLIQESPEGEPVVVPTVTLDITPEQAEVLALASTEGRLQLILRRSGDSGEAGTGGATIAMVLGEETIGKKAAVKKKRRYKKRAAPAKAPRVKKVKPRFIDVSVEVLRNGDKSIETFRVKGEEI